MRKFPLPILINIILTSRNTTKQQKSTKKKGLKLKIEYPYRHLENVPDSTKGDCPNCAKGYFLWI